MTDTPKPYRSGMTLKPGESTLISVPIPPEIAARMGAGTQFEMTDISREAFGKYQYGTMHWGLWYSDEDFCMGGGCGLLKWGAIPAPSSPDRRPWRGVIVELIRRAFGAKRCG